MSAVALATQRKREWRFTVQGAVEYSHPGWALIKRAQVPRPDPVSQFTTEQRATAQTYLHQAIEDGTVDIGPQTVGVLVSGRHNDARDPQELGIVLLSCADSFREGLPRHGPSLSEVYDKHVDHLFVPDFNPAPVDHSAHYQEELEQRAAGGDKFAQQLLDARARGENYEGEPVDR